MILSMIPQHPNEITPEWLTDALRSEGVISQANVKSVEVENMAAASGQVARLSIRYDFAEENAPHSAIIKLPAENPLWRSEDFAGGYYQSEVKFYQELADSAGLTVPRHYFSALDVKNEDYVLLLQEVASVEFSDDSKGRSISRAKLILERLAEFHARWWNISRLEQLDWLPRFSERSGYFEKYCVNYWESFIELAGKKLNPKVRELGDRLGLEVHGIMDKLSAGPVTLVHGDLHMHNILFSSSNDDSQFVVIDWQFATCGRGAIDVAYFIYRTLDVEDRRRYEADLLHSYHDALIGHGVAGYDYNSFFQDYSLAWLYNFASLLVGVATSGNSDHLPRHFEVALERLIAATLDLNLSNILTRGN